MRQQINRRQIPILHGKNPLSEITQSPTQQQSHNKRPHRHLKHSLSQHKRLKRQRRRQQCRHKRAQKRIPPHPSAHPLSPPASPPPVKRFPALLRNQIQPNAPSERSQGSHSRVIRHPRMILHRRLNNQKIGHNRKRQNRRIKKRHSKQSHATQGSHQVHQPSGQFDLIHRKGRPSPRSRKECAILADSHTAAALCAPKASSRESARQSPVRS
jgi:hypothetical protein